MFYFLLFGLLLSCNFVATVAEIEPMVCKRPTVRVSSFVMIHFGHLGHCSALISQRNTTMMTLRGALANGCPFTLLFRLILRTLYSHT